MPSARQIAENWMSQSFLQPQEYQELQELLNCSDSSEVEERFYKDLAFGTGGMRGIQGIGTNRINLYTVRKAATAYAQVLPADSVVIISYDSRLNSFEYAQEMASVLAAHHIKTQIFQELTPTPILSFAIRHLQAQGGIMVTASHNPPQYNGIKMYDHTGCQVTSPMDQDIIQAYYKLDDYGALLSADFQECLKKQLIQSVPESLEQEYQQKVLALSLNRNLCQDYGKTLSIIYTPLHGAGLRSCQQALKLLGFSQFLAVPEQAQPDGQFPTVEFPNPEDPKALKLATDLMQKEKADIVLASDPDTDRLGVVVHHQNQPHFITGNQIAILITHYLLEQLHQQGKLSSHSVVIKSLVTTEMLDAIAHKYGSKIVITLTGFKWMGLEMNQWDEQKKPYQLVLACEESYGYLNHNFARDKDGVSSIALMAEIALWYKRQNKTLIDALEDCYQEFGYYCEEVFFLTYPGKEGHKKIERIMQYFRTSPLKSIEGETVEWFHDYQKSSLLNMLDQKEKPTGITPSNVLGFTTESGSKIFLRPSGTEPKIKFYALLKGSLEQKEQTQQKLNALKKFFTRTAQEL